MQAIITVPWPPSVNHLWRRGHNGGMYLSRAGREYRLLVLAAWAEAGRPSYGDAAVCIEIEASPPDRRRRDLDNIIKAVLDALVACRCITDDQQVQELRVARVDGFRGIVTVRIWPAAAEEG